MKKIFTFTNKYITPLLLMFLVYTSYQLYDQNNNQTSRIDTLNKTLYDVAAHKHEIYKEIQKTQFKEDYYLNQLSNSTTLIMTMIAIVVTLGGFITYKTFDDKVTFTEDEINNLKDKIKEVELLTEDKINHLKKENNDEIKKLDTKIQKDLDNISSSLTFLKSEYKNNLFNDMYKNISKDKNTDIQTIIDYIQNELDYCLSNKKYVLTFGDEISIRLNNIHYHLKNRQNESLNDNNFTCDMLKAQMQALNSIDHRFKTSFNIIFNLLKEKVEYNWHDIK